MAPPLIFLLVVIVIAAVVAGAMLFGVRTGLWARETNPDAPPVPDDDRRRGASAFVDEDRRFDRPEHVETDDPAKQRFVG